MLVISQKEGEELSIGAEIVVRVLSIKKGRVKLGISAPEQLKVSRGPDSTADLKPAVKNSGV
ncbi:MAG: carbon storage regulator [Succinivibrio sp.]|nr:carbon storage regulator [Succinivibrio sp.]